MVPVYKVLKRFPNLTLEQRNAICARRIRRCLPHNHNTDCWFSYGYLGLSKYNRKERKN